MQSTVLVDVLDFIRQAGFWPMAPSLGAEGMWPGPISTDGIVLSPQDAEESAANHLCGGRLGLPTTGRAVTMRVMDFYLADQGLIRENWVPIDILQVLLQLDVDVLARVRSQFGKT